MKHIGWALFLLCFFTKANAQDNNRPQIVAQLQALKSAVLKQDKQAVARYFSFPVKDDNLKSKIEWQKKGAVIKTLDRKQFLLYYNYLFTTQVLEMFRQLDFSKMNTQDELIVENMPKSKTDYCSYQYEVIIINNQVALTYYTNTRQDVQLPEAAYCEEYAEFWTFEWQNGQLQFKTLQVAG